MESEVEQTEGAALLCGEYQFEEETFFVLIVFVVDEDVNVGNSGRHPVESQMNVVALRRIDAKTVGFECEKIRSISRQQKLASRRIRIAVRHFLRNDCEWREMQLECLRNDRTANFNANEEAENQRSLCSVHKVNNRRSSSFHSRFTG